MHKPLPELNARNFPTAQQDAKAVQSPSLYGGPESAFSLAFTDTEFLLREELRPVRMQLELLKPEMVQREQGIESTIVIFGSARISSFEVATEKLALARAAGNPQAVRAAESALAMSHFYEEARRFAALVTERSRHLPTPIYVVTGGGPGIMEAGNRGAFDVGGFRKAGDARDGLAKFNCHSLVIEVPVSTLQKDGKTIIILSTETMVLKRSGSTWKIVHIHWSSRKK